MQNFERKDLPDDDEIEISDLDAPHEKSSSVYHILRRAQAIHISPRMRITLFVLVLLIGGSIFAYQRAASLRPKTASDTYSSFQVIYTSVDPAANVSVANGIAYIFTENGKVNAQRASDGKFLWSSKEADNTLLQSPPIDTFIFLTPQNNHGNHVDALRASDGVLQWSFQTPPLASEPLLVKDGVVYILTHTGTIYALRESDGKQLWHLATRGFTPTTATEVLYASNGVTTVRTNQQTVYFIRTQDGSQLWHYTMNLPDTPASWQPDIEGDTTSIHTNTNILQVRSLISGQLRWQYTPNTGTSWSSTTQNGAVYVYSWDGSLKVLRKQDGSLLWQRNGLSHWSTWNTQQHGLLFVTQKNGSIEALRTSDGSLSWQFTPSRPSNILWLSDANDGFLYFITDTPEMTIFALRTLDGRILWHQALHNFTLSYLPEITNNILYIQQSDGSIDVWSSNDGHLLWHYQPLAQIAQDPIEVNGLVYIRQGDGIVNVLQARDGKVVWSYSPLANP